MPESMIIQSLKDKRAEVNGRIAAYQAQIAQAKYDLAHINASIRLFTDPECQRARYMVSHGFFKKGEIADICVRHLEIDGELTARELAKRVMVKRKLGASKLCRLQGCSGVAARRLAQARPYGRETQRHVRLGGWRRRHAARRCQ